jgi:hypothetical protein
MFRVCPLRDLQPRAAINGPCGEDLLVPWLGSVVAGHGHVHAPGLEHNNAGLLGGQLREQRGFAGSLGRQDGQVFGQPFGLPPARPYQPRGSLGVPAPGAIRLGAAYFGAVANREDVRFMVGAEPVVHQDPAGGGEPAAFGQFGAGADTARDDQEVAVDR